MDLEKSLDLEDQYKLFLQKSKLDEAKMNPIQRIETKRAWYAGVSQTLLLFQNVIAAIDDEDKAVMQIEDLKVQTSIFWESQI